MYGKNVEDGVRRGVGGRWWRRRAHDGSELTAAVWCARWFIRKLWNNRSAAGIDGIWRCAALQILAAAPERLRFCCPSAASKSAAPACRCDYFRASV